MPSTATGIQNVEGVVLVAVIVVGVLMWLIHRLARSREDFRIGTPVGIGFAIRMAAIAGISATGLSSTLRGGDETTFLNSAQLLAQQPLGRGDWPHGPYQLHTVLFALQLKTGFLDQGALRITQVGIATLGVVLILAAVHDLADGKAARLAAWILAFEPASIFFNSALHKEPLMELASGLVVYGGTRIWLRLDVRGILLCALGGLIAIETRAYAGWFLVCAAVVVLLHASLRSLDKPLKAMPLIYAVVTIAFIAAPAVIQASSRKSLQALQLSQNANSSGAGIQSGTANSDNLALEKVDFSSRGAILTNLPQRIRDLLLRPYPWQLSDTSQRFGAVGTLVAYVLLLLLLRYGWLARGHVFPYTAPILYPMFFLLIAYSLSAGNAGTGFRYRTHLVTLGVAAVAVLREQVMLARAMSGAETTPAREPGATSLAAPPVTSPI
jgi:hypothetical protein